MEDDFDCDSDEYEQAVAAVEEEMENDMAGGQVEEEIESDAETDIDVEPDAHVEGITTQFNPDHIITDPGLRQFSTNIRSKVRKAFIDKGPTQPIGCNFPKSKKKKMLLEKNGEYSVAKDRAYYFYCYLFKHDQRDDKCGYDVFTTLGV